VFLQQKGRCAFTGAELTIARGRKEGRAATNASIDRVDPRKGYVQGNIHWTTKQVNLVRRDLTVEDFITLCRAVATFADNRFVSTMDGVPKTEDGRLLVDYGG